MTDRKIYISVGENRKSKNWRVQEITVSALYDRLKTPFESPETMGEYLAMSRGEQDDLKDKGGFVGGVLNNPRRLKTSVVSRDLVVLDADTIPPYKGQEVIDSMKGLGVSCCAYSTRKHRQEKPRLRLVIPLDRTVTPEEFEAVARKLAETIGMGMLDPSTFEPHRLMYWPTVCRGSEYLYDRQDGELLSADRVLSQYADWRDMQQWPRHPEEAGPNTTGRKKMEDPTTKTGIVGVFCRKYDCRSAMDAFIPDVYTPTLDANRFTYAAGTTAGGAILYDNDAFLFSNHATDPCGGREVNAFDMVRIHKFGHLDTEVKEKTNATKYPSFLAMRAMIMEDGEMAAEVHAERGGAKLEDTGIAGMVADNRAVEGRKKALSVVMGKLDGGAWLTTDDLEVITNALGITVRLNEITWRVEIKGAPDEWSNVNAENQLPVHLLDLLHKTECRGANKSAVCDMLDLISDRRRYNPVADMLKAKWDGVDRETELFEMWGIQEDDLSRSLVHKWLIQCVAMAFNKETAPVGAEGVLVLQGEQGIGKTSALRQLVPIPDMFKEGARIDTKEKDTELQALSYWICELGELERTTVKDHAGLKAFVTQNWDEHRAPYARKAIRRPRRTSFCGTVNPEDYLVDETGNRRWFTVPIRRMDKERIFSITPEWAVQLWAQIRMVYDFDHDGFRLTDEEREALDRRNRGYLRALDGELEIRSLLNFNLPVEDWGEFSPTQICALGRLKGFHMVPNRLGRVLTKLCAEDERIVKKRSGSAGRMYRLPMLQTAISDGDSKN